MKRIKTHHAEAKPTKPWRYKPRKLKDPIKRIRAYGPRPDRAEADGIMQYHLARIRYAKQIETTSWKAIADYLAANDPAEPMPRPLPGSPCQPQRAVYAPGAAVRRP